jgi:hypothetical protein
MLLFINTIQSQLQYLLYESIVVTYNNIYNCHNLLKRTRVFNKCSIKVKMQVLFNYHNVYNKYTNTI